MLIHYKVLGQSGTPTGDRNEVTRRVLREVGSTTHPPNPPQAGGIPPFPVYKPPLPATDYQLPANLNSPTKNPNP